MIDLFPHARATLKAHSYFLTTLNGFVDSASRFKCFIEGEAPSLEAPFITVEMQPGGEDQRNGWADPFVQFNVHGPDTMRPFLWALARMIDSIFQATLIFAEVRMTFTANATSNVITCEQHGLIAGQVLTVSSTTTLPGGLTAATDYYVINATADTFQLSATEGGAAIDITTAGTGSHTLALRRVRYNLSGEAIYDQGQNPVTEQVVVSVSRRFGIVE